MRVEEVPVERIEPGDVVRLPIGSEITVERVDHERAVGPSRSSSQGSRPEQFVVVHANGFLVPKQRGETWPILRERQASLDDEMRATTEPPLDAGTDSRVPPLESSRLADESVPASSEPALRPPEGRDETSSPGATPRARSTDPETSHEAASSVGNVSGTQAAILDIYNLYGPMSDDELVDRYKWQAETGDAPKASESGIRTRRAELVERREVMDLGQVRTLESGRRAIVWGLTRQYDPAKAEIPFPVEPEPPL